jgi:hypothetical protein
MYTALRTGAIEKAVFVGSSNASNLAHSASALGLDAYNFTKGGWKLSKENVDKLLPDLKDLLGTLPPDTPVVIFCLDNTIFIGLNEDGSMSAISCCVEEDDSFHIRGGPRGRTRETDEIFSGAALAYHDGMQLTHSLCSHPLAALRAATML